MENLNFFIFLGKYMGTCILPNNWAFPFPTISLYLFVHTLILWSTSETSVKTTCIYFISCDLDRKENGKYPSLTSFLIFTLHLTYWIYIFNLGMPFTSSCLYISEENIIFQEA